MIHAKMILRIEERRSAASTALVLSILLIIKRLALIPLLALLRLAAGYFGQNLIIKFHFGP